MTSIKDVTMSRIEPRKSFPHNMTLVVSQTHCLCICLHYDGVSATKWCVGMSWTRLLMKHSLLLARDRQLEMKGHRAAIPAINRSTLNSLSLPWLDYDYNIRSMTNSGQTPTQKAFVCYDLVIFSSIKKSKRWLLFIYIYALFTFIRHV